MLSPKEKIAEVCRPRKNWWTPAPPWLLIDNWQDNVGALNLLMVVNGGSLPVTMQRHPLWVSTVSEIRHFQVLWRKHNTSMVQSLSLADYCEMFTPETVAKAIITDAVPPLYRYMPKSEWINSLRKIANVHRR